jgi:hypothetical protein
VSTELFSNKSCCSVACLHSCWLAVGLHVTILLSKYYKHVMNVLFLEIFRDELFILQQLCLTRINLIRTYNDRDY